VTSLSVAWEAARKREHRRPRQTRKASEKEAAFLAGTAVAGAGVGTGFFAGAYRVLTALASPSQRAGLVAAIWIIFYLAFSVPVVAAGVATTHFGLHQTAVVYSAALAVLAAAAAGSLIIRRRSRPGSPSAPPEALRASRPDLWKSLASRAFVRGGWRAGGGDHVA
jgi:hypothetical protein